jgi:predicted Zn-ribbon and HTH transcriptional regulator
MCRHCGEKFGAWNRNASLCPDCKATHHSGDPRDCGPCTENVSI